MPDVAPPLPPGVCLPAEPPVPPVKFDTVFEVRALFAEDKIYIPVDVPPAPPLEPE